MDDKQRVLDMLKAGAVSRDEAVRLLEALGEKDAVLPENLSGSAIDLPEPPAPQEPEQAQPAPPYSASPTEYVYECELKALENLSISWVSGPVEITAYEGTKVRIIEDAGRPLEQDERLCLSSGTDRLDIRWMADSGKGFFRSRFLSFSTFLKKSLFIQLPQLLAQHIEDMKCTNVSGDISAAGLHGENLNFSNTSGSIYIGGITCEDLDARSVSGAVKATGCSAENINFSSTSGSIISKDSAAEDMAAKTTSGKIEIDGNAETFKLNSVSGSISLKTPQAPEEANLSTISGRVILRVPENSGFIVNYNSMSGHFHTDFSMQGSFGNKSGKLTYGNGDSQYSLQTLSADIELYKS